MKKLIYIVCIVSLFTNCKEKKTISNVNSLLSTDKIKSSFFNVNCNKDTTIIGGKGTKIIIPENPFVNTKGEIVTGNIKLELKECISKTDIILANLHTLSNGKILESGGMIYLNATQEGENLAIADDKQIGVELLADSSLVGMSYYEGELLEDSSINWKNPIAIEPNITQEITETITDSVKRRKIIDTIYKKHNIYYSIMDYYEIKWKAEEEKRLITKIGDAIWNKISIISKDSMIVIDGHKIYLHKQDSLNYYKTYSYGDVWVPRESVNTYMEDPNTNYIFSVKNLGWANIDRLYQDKRTKRVEFITEVEDYVKFDKIFISMIFKEKNIYLPGYQRMDKTFGFSHGDYEGMDLPIGETVQILATSNQDGESFYSLESIIIEEETNVTMNMIKTSKDNCQC